MTEPMRHRLRAQILSRLPKESPSWEADEMLDAILRELAEPDDGMIEAMREEIDFHDLVGDDLAIRLATRAFAAAVKSISA